MRAGRRIAAGAAAALALCALSGLAGVPAAGAAEGPAPFWQRCDGPPPLLPAPDPECEIPRGIAADPATGNLYVADQGNSRVLVFSAWGELLRAWGWDVVESGPGEAGTGFEICVPADEDKCKAGTEGGGAGQFEIPQGVALDSEGGVYVVDKENRRVEKFDAEGHFVATFGGEVNETKVEEREAQEAASEPVTVTEEEENLCPFDPGDQCQAGVEGPGDGQFGAWKVGSFVAVGPEPEWPGPGPAPDVVYVGDAGRVQRFDTAGHYAGDLPDPEGLLAGETVQSLAADGEGNVYLARSENAFRSKEGVLKLSAASGAELCEIEAKDPRAIATGPGGEVYLANGHVIGSPPPSRLEVLRFDPDCGGGETLLDEATLSAEGFTNNPTGIAASEACGIGALGEGPDLYLPGRHNVTLPTPVDFSFVRAYGPQPDPAACPPPRVAPSIEAQYASSVSTDAAILRAQVNPHFWSGTAGTTTYYAQYATAACLEAGGWEAPCVAERPAPPGSALGGGAVDVPVTTGAIALTGLMPDTAYRYRFVVESRDFEGAPVVEGQPVIGPARAFATFPPRPAAKEDCPNQAFRTGPAARLPDCRAFELVSPIEKEGGDITARGSGLDQAASSGEALTYSTFRAFGDAQSANNLSQYLARRDPASGWQTEGVSPPREGANLWAGDPTHSPHEGGDLQLHFKAFSEDLCSAWDLESTEPTLAAAAIPAYPNLYRRRNCAPGAGSFEALSSVQPPDVGPVDFAPAIEGFSADGSRSVFETEGALSAAAAPCASECRQLYISGPTGPMLVSALPDGTASEAAFNSAGAGGLNAAQTAGTGNAHNAVSADASRIYWTTGSGGAGNLHLRVNATEPQSAVPHFTASGIVRNGSTAVSSLIAAEGEGTLSEGSPEVSELTTTTGQFVAGQPIAGAGIPAGTTVLEASASALVLSAPATASAPGVALSSEGPAPFAPGQAISGDQIPPGTKIEAVAPGELELSKPAEGNARASLEAIGACSEAAKACTLEVAEGARFWDAAPSGAAAIYTVGSLGGEGAELRRYEEASDSSVPIAAGVLGVIGASEDLGRIYLVSREALDEAGEGAAGEPNLYLFEAGTFSFVATLTEKDAFWDTGAQNPSAVNAEPAKRAARVSADGSHAAFASSASPTGYDNTDLASGEAATEVYLYDAPSAQLRCLSCNPSGARPRGANLGTPSQPVVAAATIPGWTDPLHASRALSADGSRLFFDSFDALVPADANGAEDVYEWERAPSAAACAQLGAELHAPSAGGCLSLISGGQDPQDSEFLDASPEGRDVFFNSGASLIASDPALRDVYDAREGGGFAPPPAAPPACEGEACQGPAPAPEPATPGSSSFQGPGNQKQRPGCGALAQRGRALGRRAKALRRAAKRAARHHSPRRAKRLHRRAAGRAKRAHRLAKRARRCRRAAGRAAR